MARPLEGLRVLDLSRILAGPFATQILGDLGADVIKIEDPDGGDPTRAWTPPSFGGQSAYYLCANRNKRSRALDFSKNEDRRVILDLAKKADVLVENFKVGALKKYELDYDSLKGMNSKLIYCSITGFGQTGPRASQPGYDAMIQAMGGLMSITGSDAKNPTKGGVAIADLGTGLYAVVAILAAVIERERSGKGQWIDLSLFDAQVSLLANVGMNFLCNGETPVPLGNAHPSIVPYESFRTQDKVLMVSVGTDGQFQKLCDCMGQTQLATDSRFRTNESRVKNRSTLIPILQSEFLKHTCEEWHMKLDKLGIPCGPVQSLQDLKSDPQLKYRNLFTVMNDSKTPCIASPLRFSRTPIQEYKKPPEKGADPHAEFKENA